MSKIKATRKPIRHSKKAGMSIFAQAFLVDAMQKQMIPLIAENFLLKAQVKSLTVERDRLKEQVEIQKG
jgi:hypothetical protein